MTHNVEKKFITLDLKQVDEDGTFEGYASKFGDVDRGNDVVMPGAYTKTLAAKRPRDVKMLWQHDPAQPIGVWDEMKEDSVGLWVKGRLLTSVAKAREVYDLMKADVINGLSIGYRTVRATNDQKTGARQLKEVDLWEISLVTFPMLPSATVTQYKGDWTKRDAERVLRDAGMPNAMAVKLIAGGWDAANSSEVQGEPDNGLGDIMSSLQQLTDNLKRRL